MKNNTLLKHYFVSAFFAGLSLYGLLPLILTLVDRLERYSGDYSTFRAILLTAILILVDGMFVFFFLVRRVAKEESTEKLSYFWAVLGTYLPLFFAFNDLKTIPVVDLLILASTIFSLYAVYSLGRSTDLVVANRGIVKNHAYRFIRHPLYSSYILVNVLYLLISSFSVTRIILFLMWLVSIYMRIRYEEKLLGHSVTYKEYAKKVRYRLFPHIW